MRVISPPVISIALGVSMSSTSWEIYRGRLDSTPMPTSPQRPDVGSGKGDPLTGKCSGGARGESRSSRYPFGWLGPLDPVGKHTLKAHFDAPFPGTQLRSATRPTQDSRPVYRSSSATHHF